MAQPDPSPFPRSAPKIEELEKVLPAEVRESLRSFLLGVDIATDGDETVVVAWRTKLEESLSVPTPADPESVETAKQTIELLKRDFTWLVVRPRAYKYLLRMWSYTLLAVFLSYALVGSEGFFKVCENALDKDSRFALVGTICSATHGHFVGYIAFRYAVFGVLVGTALLGSMSMARSRFAAVDRNATLLSRPVLRATVAFALAYVLSLFVASGKLELNMLGFQIKPDVHFETDCPRQTPDKVCPEPRKALAGANGLELKEANGGETYCCYSLTQPGFRDATALFAIGISAAIATEIYLSRLVKALRGAAESSFRTEET